MLLEKFGINAGVAQVHSIVEVMSSGSSQSVVRLWCSSSNKLQLRENGAMWSEAIDRMLLVKFESTLVTIVTCIAYDTHHEYV